MRGAIWAEVHTTEAWGTVVQHVRIPVSVVTVTAAQALLGGAR